MSKLVIRNKDRSIVEEEVFGVDARIDSDITALPVETYDPPEAPTILEEVATLEVKAHSHANKTVLDKLGATEGYLTYEGNAISGGEGGPTSWSQVTNKPTTFAPTAHNHAQADVTGLATALSGKANSSHTHAESDVTGLVTALEGKAASTHSHAAGDLSGVVKTINGSAPDSSGDVVIAAGGGGVSLYKNTYNLNGDANSSYLLATGTNATITKSGILATISHNGDTVLSGCIYFTATEVGTGAKVQIDFDAEKTSDYLTNRIPQLAVLTDASGNRAYKTTAAFNMNINDHTVEITDLTASMGCWVNIAF